MTALPTKERRRAVRTATVLLAGAGIFIFACSESEYRTLGYGVADGGSAPVFGEDPDAGEAGTNDELTLYCPSSECPAGWTTCPGSRFRCGVDLRSDSQNCGACGHVCPQRSTGTSESWTCVEGECVMVCSSGNMPAYDCDGLPDNGCEVRPSNDNCGGCGIKCTDPERPCLQDEGLKYQCGCSNDWIYCGTWPCRDPETDDDNCGACGNVCDRTGGPGAEPPKPFMYYGCFDRECGNLKCESGRDDCDLELENGCETPLTTDENCGACGKACDPGTFCALDPLTRRPFCACPGTQSFCGSCIGGTCLGGCVEFSSDPNHCGGCGLSCGNPPPNATPICSYGSCGLVCNSRFADCNGNTGDGCETETDRDPRNCGGCGISCDEATGQACVGGRCVVAPCDESDAGVIPR